MSDLKDKKCVPCEGGVIPFDISEIHKYQKKVDGWDIIKNNKDIYFLALAKNIMMTIAGLLVHTCVSLGRRHRIHDPHTKSLGRRHRIHSLQTTLTIGRSS